MWRTDSRQKTILSWRCIDGAEDAQASVRAVDADPFFDAKAQFAKKFVDQFFADANAAAGDAKLNPIARFDADEGVEIVEAASTSE